MRNLPRNLVGLLLLSTPLAAQPTTSDFIRVDQFGYRPGAEKVAVIAAPQTGFDAPATFAPSTGPDQYQVRRTADGAVVFSGTLQAWNGGATDPTSGDRAWWFDFSAVTAPGSYYVFDLGRARASFSFDIKDDVYAPVLRAAVRTFYYQRCNFAKEARFAGPNWADGPSFSGPRQDGQARSVFDKTNPATERDLSGGWWDAGDYNKYVTFARTPVHQLLSAYSENPALWTDDFQLPESGNGLPDLLDEVKYELDWLRKMQLPDGSSLVKVGTVFGDWTATLPPSTDARARYYYPGGCTAATISAAGMFAHAALVLGKFPAWQAYAADLRSRAIRGFANFEAQPSLQTDCDARGPGVQETNIIFAGDADMTAEDQRQAAVQTAIYLYALTGEAAYRDFVDANYTTIRSVSTNSWGPGNCDFGEALLYYTTLPTATATVATAVRTSAANSAGWAGIYRFDRPASLDPYRCFVESYMYNWGSSMTRAQVLNLNQNVLTFGLDPGRAAEYRRKAAEGLHYFHGVNPLNLVYLTNMGGLGAEKSVDELFHSWFSAGSAWSNVQTSAKGGPAPGYVPGGPNPYYRDASGNCPLSPPCGQPAQKSYRSWNEGTSYMVTEPAIYYQAAYIKALAKQVPAPAAAPLPVQLSAFGARRVAPTSVLVAWQTASETNSAYFSVEKSADGLAYAAIGQVPGYGTSAQPRRYELRDAPAATAAAYYRLAQYDQDGARSYSPTAFVAAAPAGAGALQASPNPARETLLVAGATPGHALLLRDAQGRLARRFTSATSPLDLRGLAPGVYLLAEDGGIASPTRVLVAP